MSDAVTQARELVKARMSEIDNERKKLTKALEALRERPPSRRRRRSTRSQTTSSQTSAAKAGMATTGTVRARRTSSGRRRRGELQRTILAHVRQNPGSRPGEIAKAVNAKPSSVSHTLKKLGEEGQITRDDGKITVGGNTGSNGKTRSSGKRRSAGNTGSTAKTGSSANTRSSTRASRTGTARTSRKS